VVIRALRAADRNTVVELSVRAWAPNFASMRALLGDELDRRQHGDDWRGYQERSVIATITEPANRSWVAEREDRRCGFVAAAVVDPARGLGEIVMIAVAQPNKATVSGARSSITPPTGSARPAYASR
jgi:hypothetical protein